MPLVYIHDYLRVLLLFPASQKGQTVLHIAGSYSQVECLQEIHTKLEATSVQELGQVEDNPYLKTDKVATELSCASMYIYMRMRGKRKLSNKQMHWLIKTDAVIYLFTSFIFHSQKGYNVLHCMCSGPSGSVKILKWLFETMPHLKSPQPKGPDILNLGSKVNIAYDYQ